MQQHLQHIYSTPYNYEMEGHYYGFFARQTKVVSKRRACSVRDITRWMTEELGRYSPEVKEVVEKLKFYGITHFGSKL